jgi:arsenate reductase
LIQHNNSISQRLCGEFLNKLMKKIYYLSTCDTCKRIISELELKDMGFVFQDIKIEKITSAQLEEMKSLAGSYEALFSRIARKYKELDLATKTLTEADYKKFILDEYTFLKRPVILLNNKIFVGNSKAVIAEAKKAL